jgi:G3E family GTPase
VSADEPIPVTVVTGFLGAGKTTLLNRWLAASPRGEVAVIVNEHGDVGIDGELLAERARAVVEITGGCVCCTTQADLVRALDGFAAAKPPPKRIVIETSGAASPAGVLVAITRRAQSDAFALDGVVTVADATRLDALCDHDLAFEQLGYADIVVLSRADACDRGQLAHAADIARSRSGAAFIVESARGEVVAPATATASTLEELLALRRADFASWTERREAPAALASHVYESVSLSLDGDVDGERFADFVESDLAPVGGRLFRTKGILAVAGVEERMIVQGVADVVEVTFGARWGESRRTSRFVLVGFGLERAALARAFAACAADDGARLEHGPPPVPVSGS